MIHFKNIKWQNFLSTGNAWTEIDFQRSPSTLIVGDNGSGKSTLLDALTYSLFNKPFRSVSIPQLINSINGKGMSVEINFAIGSKNYTIRRGLGPRHFDIEIDGETLDKEANIRDMQKYLEDNILKLNYKSFTQIVMLGSASFTPFMQLHLGARREIIEDILDISIFSSMNQVLKTKYTQLENQVRIIEGEIQVARSKAEVQETYIQTLEEDRDAKVKEILEKISEERNAIETTQETANELQEEKESLGDVQKTKGQLDTYRDRFQRQIEQHEKQIEFLTNHDDCPTCQQGIPHEHKEKLTAKDTEKKDELAKALEDLETKYEEVQRLSEQLIEIDNKIMEGNNKIITHQRIVQRLQVELNDTQEKVGNIDEEKAKLKKLAKQTINKVKEKNDQTETEHYYNVVQSMLKDSGIKTKIIKEYLPIINKLVNKYLAAMDFFVQFD